MKRALDLSFDVLTTPERLGLLESCERFRRQLPAVEHPLINQVGEQASAAEVGGRLASVLADRLRITRPEAGRRIGEAEDLGERRAITGEPLAPQLEATAAAQRAGDLGAAHVAVIRGFVHRLPNFVDAETRAQAEAQLAQLAVSIAPTSWPSWPTSSPIALTPTEISPTRIEPVAAVSRSASRTATA